MVRMMKKNILIATALEYPHQGGVSSHIELLIRGLSKNNNVIVISRSNISKVLERLCFIIAGIFSLINKGYGYYIYHRLIGSILRKKVKKYIKKYNIDIIHIHSTNFAFTEPFTIPSVLTCHADITNEMLGQGKLNLNTLAEQKFYQMEYKCYISNDCIIAVDERLKQHVLSIASNANVIAMINFIDPDEFLNHELSIDDYKALGIPLDKDILLCPRRIVIKNGVIYAVKILENLPDNYHLVLIGGGDKLASIESYITEQNLTDRVTIIPGIDRMEIAKFYNISTFVLIPSITVNNLQEATSIAALEGMSCGKVVVASAIGGLVQLIEDGKTGILFNEKDSDVAVKKIRDLKDHQIKQIGQMARQKVINDFGYIEACNTIENIYNELLKKK